MQAGGSAAMAALSALLRSLQADGTAHSSAVVSPQASDGVEVSAPSAGALPRGPTAEKRSDPLEQVEEEGQAGQALEQDPEEEQAADEWLDVEALLPGDGAGGAGNTWHELTVGAGDPATPLALQPAATEAATIPAQWQPWGSSTASAHARSRIPLPPPVGSTRTKPSPLVCSTGSKPERTTAGPGAQTSPSKGSTAHPNQKPNPLVGSTSPGRGIKALFGCGSPSATLSSSRL